MALLGGVKSKRHFIIKTTATESESGPNRQLWRLRWGPQRACWWRCKHISVVVTLRRAPQSRGKGLLPACWRNPFWLQWKETRPTLTVRCPCQVRPPDVGKLSHYQRLCRASVWSNSWSRSAPLGSRFAVIAATFLSLYRPQINPEQRFTTAITSGGECVCYSTGLGCRFTQLGAFWASCSDYSSQAPPTVLATKRLILESREVIIPALL